ncbi:MAG: hypothetical protein FD187_957 [bacterium]|nr:MAG: hypothetical protein FD142_88 [bacterium]KAF0149663.1 MAG: hypothetical protein FD187_957 [bacterium]KAF0169329.1 MAG: hypothetical protein FD158_519 [bacterium]TXT21397.1 MAG: hypothetical protein FD132_686 [bacterium]
MNTENSSPWLAGFKEDYEKIFIEPWSPYLGMVLLILVIMGLMVSGLIWGVFGGLKLWGDWFNNAIGLGPVIGTPQQLDSPLMHRMSLMNITLVGGAFCAALLSRQFLVNRPPKQEYVWAALGGSLMGLGASLAVGCTVGGFFIPLLHSSPAGWAMWLGLIAGAAIGLKSLLWSLEHITWGMQAPPAIKVPKGLVTAYPLIGLAVVLGIVAWAADWYASEDQKLVTRAIIVLAGFAMGFIIHRSRLCFARAFREPFMTAEGDMTKAVILGVALGFPLASLLFQAKVIDPYIAIPTTYWAGSLIGGLIFGIGMIFAGGCGTGSLWRMGEGHLKLWVAAFFFAWAGSTASALLKNAGLTVAEMNLDLVEESPIGIQAYFPVMFDGWAWAYAISGGLLLVWYLLVRYNESSEKFTLL